MKAAVLEAQDAPFAVKDVEAPEPDAQEAIVKIRAAALNHRDIWIQKGQYVGLRYPIILGSDGAGTVTKVGHVVDNDLIDRDVIINPSMNWGGNERVQSKDFKILGLPENGTFAEYVKVPASSLVAKPAHLNFEQAAALPLAGLTAYRALFTRASLQGHEKALVTGAGGGVAQFAIQFALSVGAEVYVTSGSEEKIAASKRMGVQGGVNYKNEGWAEQLKEQAGPFQVIIDSAGGDSLSHLIDLADMGARITIYGGTLGKINNLSPQKLFWKQVAILGSTMGSSNDFARMLKLVEHYQIEPVIDKTFPLEQAEDAARRMDQAQQFGKVVLSLE